MVWVNPLRFLVLPESRIYSSQSQFQTTKCLFLSIFPSFPTSSFPVYLLGLRRDQQERGKSLQRHPCKFSLALLPPVRAALQMSPICCCSPGSHLWFFRCLSWDLLHRLVPDLGDLLWLMSSAASPSAQPVPLSSVTLAGGRWGLPDGSSLDNLSSLHYTSGNSPHCAMAGVDTSPLLPSPLTLLVRSRHQTPCSHLSLPHFRGHRRNTQKLFCFLCSGTLG